MKDKKHFQIIGFTTLIAVSLLSGCSSTENKDQPEPSVDIPVTEVIQASVSAPVSQADLPDEIEGELIVITAKVKAINKKKREVTLQSADGKIAKVKCGPEVRNFKQIRVGDEVKTTLLESIELLVTEKEQPAAERVTEVDRAPLGSKPNIEVVDAVEVSASIVDIDYQTREVTLKGPEGRVLKMTAGPEIEHLEQIKVGDFVVARLTRAVSIEVSKPAKK
jgi:hypothetical protein